MAPANLNLWLQGSVETADSGERTIEDAEARIAQVQTEQYIQQLVDAYRHGNRSHLVER